MARFTWLMVGFVLVMLPMIVAVCLSRGGRQLICQGAPEAVYARCGSFALESRIQPLDKTVLESLVKECACRRRGADLALPHRLVCGVAADADTHHPCDSY
ncbi:MAG: hypothetical protein WCQ77_06075 [Planctomycetota bacterium]